MSDHSNLLVISTGGTIEAKFYENPHSPDHKIELLPENPLPEMLETLAVRARFVEAPKRQDSREFSQQDLDELTAFIRGYYQQGYHHMIVSHGTFHMPRNFEYIESQLAKSGIDDLTLIAVGANVPYHNTTLASDHPSYAESDALSNLAFAIQKLTELSSGVYLADGGEIYRPATTEKSESGRSFMTWHEGKPRETFVLRPDNA